MKLEIRSVEYVPRHAAPEPPEPAAADPMPRDERVGVCLTLTGSGLCTLAGYVGLYQWVPDVALALAPGAPLAIALALIPPYFLMGRVE